jgi:flagellar assembly protein FliH
LSRTLFKSVEIAQLGHKVPLAVPVAVIQRSESEEEAEYKGPSIEEVEAEVERLRADAQKQVEQAERDAQERFEQIRTDAENNAFDRIKKASDEAKLKISEADLRAREIISEAELRAKEILMEAEGKVAEIETQARDRGYDDGRNKGYDEGKEEVNRLINSLNRIISATIERRNEIIKNVEQQLMMIVLLIARKVIKTISEHQKGVVMQNIREALYKVRGRTDVVIRVNIEDLELTTEHKEEFLKLMDDIKNVTVLEDSTVDRGGCIIETDFGNIDARMASQFQEIENRIKEIMPITVSDDNSHLL